MSVVAPAGARAGPHFGGLLVVIIAVYIVVIAFGSTAFGQMARVVLIALVLLTVVRIRRAGQRGASLTAVGVVLALAAGAIAYGAGSVWLAVVLVSGAILLMVGASVAVILGVLVGRRTTDGQTVAGALAVYLLLALLFATLHQLFAALFGLPYIQGAPEMADSARYLYFSVITLTTVGYGDLIPACNTARAVAMSEALVGQLYLVAVVGTVVGNLGGFRRSPPVADDRPPVEG